METAITTMPFWQSLRINKSLRLVRAISAVTEFLRVRYGVIADHSWNWGVPGKSLPGVFATAASRESVFSDVFTGYGIL